MYVAARSQAKGETAVAEIRASTGNDEVFYLPGNADPLPAAHASAGLGPSSAAGDGVEIADDE